MPNRRHEEMERVLIALNVPFVLEGQVIPYGLSFKRNDNFIWLNWRLTDSTRLRVSIDNECRIESFEMIKNFQANLETDK